MSALHRHALSTLALASLSFLAQAESDLTAARQTQLKSSAETFVRQFPGMSLHGSDHSYEARNIAIDADGAGHVRLERRIAGLRAIGADLVVQTDRFGNLAAMHQTSRRLPRVDTTPTLSAGRAAIAALDVQGGSWQGRPEL